MTATGHALVGTLIAGKVTNPYLAFGVNVLLHFPCDLLPHWDAGTNHKRKSGERIFYEAVADVLISFVSSYAVYFYILGKTDFSLLALSVFAAQLPDWIAFPYFLWKIKFWPSKMIDKVQNKWHNSLDKPWGIVTQVGAVLGLYIVLYVLF